MAVRIKKIYKEQLSDLLAKGHAVFGKVAPRRPYRDEEEEGGAGSGLTLLQHPLLMNMPVGAASDLTAITTENSEVLEEAMDRVEECCPQLQQQPQLSNVLAHGRSFNPRPSVY